ncbi:MAG: hypothetical protein BroJett003_20810 [Planctomycetota bacterium]|nr:MAG: hypothetical protein BroJett003_20810 [Planctomycetota bacterium]
MNPSASPPVARAARRFRTIDAAPDAIRSPRAHLATQGAMALLTIAPEREAEPASQIAAAATADADPPPLCARMLPDSPTADAAAERTAARRADAAATQPDAETAAALRWSHRTCSSSDVPPQ